MFYKINARFYTQKCKVGRFLYYLGKTPSEKSLDFCNIPHGFVSKWKKNKIMKNLTQVSDLAFRQFVHMPVVLPASCCSR